jgi:hypothetical protein
MPSASAFRHPKSQSGTGAFLYRTGSGIGMFVHSGTGLTGCQTARHLENTGEKGYIHTLHTLHTLHVYTASDGLGYTRHGNSELLVMKSSVGDPKPDQDPQDLHVFGPP